MPRWPFLKRDLSWREPPIALTSVRAAAAPRLAIPYRAPSARGRGARAPERQGGRAAARGRREGEGGGAVVWPHGSVTLGSAGPLRASEPSIVYRIPLVCTSRVSLVYTSLVYRAPLVSDVSRVPLSCVIETRRDVRGGFRLRGSWVRTLARIERSRCACGECECTLDIKY